MQLARPASRIDFTAVSHSARNAYEPLTIKAMGSQRNALKINGMAPQSPPPAFLPKRDRPLWARESARVAAHFATLRVSVSAQALHSSGTLGACLWWPNWPSTFPASREFTGKEPHFGLSRARKSENLTRSPGYSSRFPVYPSREFSCRKQGRRLTQQGLFCRFSRSRLRCRTWRADRAKEMGSRACEEPAQ